MAPEKKSLPFVYQFGAGAVAGVSEVCSNKNPSRMVLLLEKIDSKNYRKANNIFLDGFP